VQWDRSFKQLKCYKEAHGNCDVSRANGEEYKTLKRWVLVQRAVFKSKILSKEKIQALNELGFEWKVTRGRKKVSVSSETSESHVEQSKSEYDGV
jgi:hypothetical protein